MQLGRVIGTVVATRKVEGLDGIRLLYVVGVDANGASRGHPFVAADVTLAGPGDIVHLTASREASLAMPEPFVPVDAAILSIVDHVGGVDLRLGGGAGGGATGAKGAADAKAGGKGGGKAGGKRGGSGGRS